MIDQNELMETVIPLRIIQQDIEKHCYHKPSAIMVPLSFAPDYDLIYGLPIIRGDRFALIYEAL